MFELVKALNDGAQQLAEHTTNPISLNAGCQLFIAFVTLFPHDSDVRWLLLDLLLLTSISVELYRSQERAHPSWTELRQRSTHLSPKNRRVGRRFHQGWFSSKFSSF